MKKKLVALLLVVALCAVALVGCGSSAKSSKIYKFYSLTVDDIEGSDFDTTFATMYVSKMLEGTIVEIKPDGKAAVYSPISGFRDDLDMSEIFEESDSGDSEVTIEDDALYISADGMQILFSRASEEEIALYNSIAEKNRA